MTEETRAARRPGRRVPEVRCRTGAVPAPRVPDGREPGRAPGATTGLWLAVTRTGGDTVVAAVTGEIDVHTADTLRARLIELHDAGHRRLVVDFGAVPFCDAAGLGALVAAHNHVAAGGGEIVLAGVRPAQLRLLRITGLHRLFALYAGVGDAVAAEGTSTTSR